MEQGDKTPVAVRIQRRVGHPAIGVPVVDSRILQPNGKKVEMRLAPRAVVTRIQEIIVRFAPEFSTPVEWLVLPQFCRCTKKTMVFKSISPAAGNEY